ncbi:MAG: amino acid ABC transporter substrate-binding protein [Rhodobacteraceae bacterium]|jgi:general L-amino acid transport system substrate-binding protein|nr:amino acid ABC transporter substrate-binding protein [Paracoccaceae bacterium]
MRFLSTMMAAAGLLSAAWGTAAPASTLSDVRDRGTLRCGVHIEKPGFSTTDASGVVSGFDIDFCKAAAAAIGVEPEFLPLSPQQRFTALTSGAVEVLLMTTTQTMNRDTKLGADFPFINFYGGGMLMVPRSLGVTSTTQLDGASICMSAGTTADQFLADYFRKTGQTYSQVLFEKLEDGFRAFVEGRCDAFTQDDTSLAAMRMTLANPDDFVILPELLSKEPVGAVTRQNDSEWNNVMTWVFAALVNAEELGLTQANVEDMAATSEVPEIQRLLGATGTLGPDAGLAQDWAVRAIRAVGNYGEIFDRHLGTQSRFNMARGINDLWSRGGLIYGLPIR